MSIRERLTRAVRRLGLLIRGSRVVAAVSGGSDSVALVRLLHQLQGELGVSLAGLAHVNHQLRGAASDEDEIFCRTLARELGLPASIERVTIERPRGVSPEDAARRARYAALERARVALGADCVAVAHTRDDQAETVLLKLLRGSGARGLGGIHPSVGPFVRPLLDVGREELREWLRSHGHGWVEDATNSDVSVPRNRIRHRVLPQLHAAMGTDVTAALARCAEISRAEGDWLDSLTDAALAQLVRRDASGLVIDAEGLALAPLALQRRALLQLVREAGAVQPGFEDIERLRELVTGDRTSVEVGGGVRAERIGPNGVLVSRAGAIPTSVADYRYDLPVPGRIEVPGTEWAVSAEVVADPAVVPGSAGRPTAHIDRAAAAPGLAVRNWRPGDWMRPLGLGGRKKLQDVFVDGKLPRQSRRRLPLVVDAQDHVVWVPGLALDDAARVTADTKAVVVLTMFQVGGPA